MAKRIAESFTRIGFPCAVVELVHVVTGSPSTWVHVVVFAVATVLSFAFLALDSPTPKG